eukprot:3983956-Prymnesium_polylepis.1
MIPRSEHITSAMLASAQHVRPRRNTLCQERSIRASSEAHGAPRADEHCSNPSAVRARAMHRALSTRATVPLQTRSWSTSAAAHAAESTM